MAQHDRLHTLNSMLAQGIIPLYYHGDPETAIAIARACLDGGAPVIEFTNRGDFAIEVFAHIEKEARCSMPGLIMGVGSVLDAPTAAAYIAAGTNFIVSPCFNAEVARLCNRRRIPYMPGCMTVTEIQTAEEWGSEIIKIFPGTAAGGPDFIKSVLAPMPRTRLMPTGGVEATESSLRAWFGAGAVCAGLGSQLIRADLIKAADWSALTRDVAQTRELVDRIRLELKGNKA